MAHSQSCAELRIEDRSVEQQQGGLKFILAGVLDNIKTQRGFVQSLDNRVKTMNNELLRIDILMCRSFNIPLLPADLNRIARADGQKDARKD